MISKTLSTLKKLDGKHKGELIQGLAERGYINSKASVISLAGADLRNVKLASVNLENVNLSSTNLEGANLEGAKFK